MSKLKHMGKCDGCYKNKHIEETPMGFYCISCRNRIFKKKHPKKSFRYNGFKVPPFIQNQHISSILEYIRANRNVKRRLSRIFKQTDITIIDFFHNKEGKKIKGIGDSGYFAMENALKDCITDMQ